MITSSVKRRDDILILSINTVFRCIQCGRRAQEIGYTPAGKEKSRYCLKCKDLAKKARGEVYAHPTHKVHHHVIRFKEVEQ